jgi:hypothetical protein
VTVNTSTLVETLLTPNKKEGFNHVLFAMIVLLLQCWDIKLAMLNPKIGTGTCLSQILSLQTNLYAPDEVSL